MAPTRKHNITSLRSWLGAMLSGNMSPRSSIERSRAFEHDTINSDQQYKVVTKEYRFSEPSQVYLEMVEEEVEMED